MSLRLNYLLLKTLPPHVISFCIFLIFYVCLFFKFDAECFASLSANFRTEAARDLHLKSLITTISAVESYITITNKLHPNAMQQAQIRFTKALERLCLSAAFAFLTMKNVRSLDTGVAYAAMFSLLLALLLLAKLLLHVNPITNHRPSYSLLTI